MLSLLTNDVIENLKPKTGVNVIVTVGNSFRKDDGVGSYIASQITASKSFTVIDASLTPENIIDDVIKLNPSYVIFIDCADFKGFPGEVKVINETDIQAYSVSTHSIPLPVFSQIIKSETNSAVCFIGIQPLDVSFGEGISVNVQEAAKAIIKIIK